MRLRTLLCFASALIAFPTIGLSESTMESPQSRREVRGNMAEMREEAAYRLGVEAARHLGIDADGKKSYQKLEQEKKQQESQGQQKRQTETKSKP